MQMLAPWHAGLRSFMPARPHDTRPPLDDRSREVLRRGVKSALARWVIAKRGGGAASRPTPKDEATHAWDGSPQYAEDYTFVGVQEGMAVVARLEWIPGRDAQRVWVVVLRPDGVWALPGGEVLERGTADDRWQAGGLRLDCVTPLREWTLRFEGTLQRQRPMGEPLRVVADTAEHQRRASFELRFSTRGEPWIPGTDDDPELLARRLGEAQWDSTLWRAARKSTNRGYLQVGRLNGTVAIGDHVMPVRASCLRQHYWGPRDWTASDQAFQCFFSTADERHGFVHHARFPFVTLEGGFVAHRGERQAIRWLGLTAAARPHRAPGRVELKLGEIDGDHTVVGKVLADVSIEVDGRARADLGLITVDRPSPGVGLWLGLRPLPPR